MKKLLALLFTFAGLAAAQSTITDTLRDARGVLVSGGVRISWNTPFTTTAGVFVPSGAIDVQVKAGAFTVSLYPNDTSCSGPIPLNPGCTATHDLSYTVSYFLPNYTRGPETWIVTTGGPFTIQQVITSAPPVALPPSVIILPAQISGAGATLNWVLGWDGTKTTWRVGGGGGGAVSSVFGRAGVVVSAANDYNFNQLAGSASAAQLPNAGVHLGSCIGTFPTITCPNATAGATGMLTAADWSTFNGKQAALSVTNDSNVTGSVAGGAFTLGWTGVLAAARMTNAGVHTGSCVGTFPAITCPTATGSIPGFISAADWTTFNAKQSTLSFINDTNLTGSISGGVATLAWASTLAAVRMVNAGIHTGDCTGTFPSCILATINSTVGTYGDATHVGQFTVDAKGRITAAAAVAITSGGAGTVTTFSISGPSWLTWTVSNPTSTPAASAAPTTAQTSHQVIGTCNAATTFTPCNLVAGDLPSIPLATGVTGLLPHANIAATAVTPGSYTNANVTVGADGSITAASNGSATGISGLTTNKIPKAASSTTIADSSVTDNGTTVTSTENMQAPAFVGTDTSHSGADYLQGVTSGGVAFAAADVAGTAITYVVPSTNGVAAQVLSDSGVTTCPNLPAGLPTTCHLLVWVAQTGGAGGTAVAPYSATVTAQTSVTVTAATHGQGTLAVAYCFDNSSPVIAYGCSYTRNGSGDLVFTFAPAFTGSVEIGAGGGSVGIPDPGSNGVLARTALNVVTPRTITGTSPVTITNGDGVAGNPTAACATCTTNAAALTANLPVIGAGGQATAVGTRTGNTTQFASWTGAATAARCVDTDASGNLQITAFDCGAGTGTVTTFSGSGPAWLTWTVTNPTTTPAASLAPTTGQTSHQVIGTCNAATIFAPCALVAGDLPLIPLTTGVTGLLPHANIAATAVTPGSYTNANLTVAADGSITAASNGSGGGTAVAPYSATVTAQTSVSVTAATHGQGTLAIAACFDNGTPAIAYACSYTRAANGDIVFTFSPAFTGTVNIGAGGGSVGITDPGSNGLLARTALNTEAARTITGTANHITVTNGNGVADNPTIDLPAGVSLPNPTMGTGYLSTSKTAGAAGTTVNLLVKIDTTGNVVTAATTDVGVLGVAVSTATSGNPVEVATRGIINCIADNTTVIGNVAIVGTATAGRCRDSGQSDSTTVASNVQVVGKFLSVATVGVAASLQLYGPGHYGAQVINSGIANGTIDLTTKVTNILPNANTTATSANTASAIVARDVNGDFAARTITGNSFKVTTINDANGNPFLVSSATASAVDSVTVTNAATANPATVIVGAAGSDSNINLNLLGKGTGGVISAGMLQPIMPIGTNSLSYQVGSGATSANLSSPNNVANGDLEIAWLGFTTATPGTITPPAGWTAITSCNASGNGVTIAAFSHTASSEGANTGSFSWTNATGITGWTSAYRNARVDICSATTAAVGSFSTPSLTATATTDRIVATVFSSSGSTFHTSALLSGELNEQYQFNYGLAQMSYPITSTTVASRVFTGAGGSTAGMQLALSFVPGTTAGPQGAITFGQHNAGLGSLILTDSCPTGLVATLVTGPFGTCGIQMPNSTPIWMQASDGHWLPELWLDYTAAALHVGADDGQNIQFDSGVISVGKTPTFKVTAAYVTALLGTAIQSTGGTAPTLAAGCNGAGSSVTAGSTNNRGTFTGQTAAATSCTLSFSAAGTWNQAPFCTFFDANASITPFAYSAGAVSTSTAVVNFASAANPKIGYMCF